MLSSALPRGRTRSPIIAALALALVVVLAGCSLVKVAYGQATPIAFRLLDGYFDFDDAQSLRVRTALDDAMAWHRRTQLPDYVELLARAEVELQSDTTPERVCAWFGDLRRRADTVAQQVAPAVAEIGQTLTAAQVVHMEKHIADKNADWRGDHLQRDPEKRRKAMIKRINGLAEMLYGDLDDAQRELVVRSVAVSPQDSDLLYAERLRRQHDAVALARRLSSGNLGRDEAVAQVRGLLRSIDRSPNEAFRQHAERVLAYECAFASALHNSTSAAQRRAAAQKLRGYEGDLRALTAEAAS
jgi:hypothetical protein